MLRRLISRRHHWFPGEMTSEKRAQKYHTDGAYYPDLGSASDWSCRVGNLLQPIRSSDPDLGSDASSVWNFCACFVDVISRRRRWWRRKMSAVFSGCNSCCQFLSVANEIGFHQFLKRTLLSTLLKCSQVMYFTLFHSNVSH